MAPPVVIPDRQTALDATFKGAATLGPRPAVVGVGREVPCVFGRRMRAHAAWVVVELANRRPVAVRDPSGVVVVFDEDGGLDQGVWHDQLHLAVRGPSRLLRRPDDGPPGPLPRETLQGRVQVGAKPAAARRGGPTHARSRLSPTKGAGRMTPMHDARRAHPQWSAGPQAPCSPRFAHRRHSVLHRTPAAVRDHTRAI